MMPYTTVDMVKIYAHRDPDDTTADILIELIIEAVDEAIDAYCYRSFTPATETRMVSYQDAYDLILPWDLHQLLSVTTNNDITLLVADNPGLFVLEPQKGPPYRRIRVQQHKGKMLQYRDTPLQALAVHGTWGYLTRQGTTPARIRMAAAAWSAALLIHTESNGVSSEALQDMSTSFNSALSTALEQGPAQEVRHMLDMLRARPIDAVTQTEQVRRTWRF